MTPDIKPLDPAPAPTVPTANDAALLSVVATDQTASVPVDVLPAKHQAPIAWLISGGVATVCLVGVLVVALTSPAAVPSAFADWTPQPNANLTTQQVGLLVNACTAVFPAANVVDGEGNVVVSSSVKPVVVDERGSHFLIIAAAPGWLSVCAGQTTPEPAPTFSTAADVPSWAPPAGEIVPMGATLFGVPGAPAAKAGQPQAFEIDYGLVGADVAKVQVVTDLGVTADASLGGGYWAVFAPVGTSVVGNGSFTTYIITRTDGEKLTIDLNGSGPGLCSGTQNPPDGVACAPN